MKRKYYLIYLTSLFLVFSSCGDDDQGQPDPITTVIQRIMNENNVTILEHCSQSFGCSGTLYFLNEYEFIGEHMLRLEESFYDLTELSRYEILTVDEVKRMRLYFNN